jgi:hypothetical protein
MPDASYCQVPSRLAGLLVIARVKDGIALPLADGGRLAARRVWAWLTGTQLTPASHTAALRGEHAAARAHCRHGHQPVTVGEAPHYGVAFGGYERLTVRDAACAWGTVTVKAVEVDSGGITREGACLPTAGGH